MRRITLFPSAVAALSLAISSTPAFSSGLVFHGRYLVERVACVGTAILLGVPGENFYRENSFRERLWILPPFIRFQDGNPNPRESLAFPRDGPSRT